MIERCTVHSIRHSDSLSYLIVHLDNLCTFWSPSLAQQYTITKIHTTVHRRNTTQLNSWEWEVPTNGIFSNIFLGRRAPGAAGRRTGSRHAAA